MLALLGMELRRPDVSRVDNRRKFDFVIRRGKNDVVRLRLDIVGVDEIDKSGFPDPFHQSIRALRMKLIPAHVGYAQAGGGVGEGPVQQPKTEDDSKILAFVP